MSTRRARARLKFETVAAYGAASLLPVLVLGVVLAGNYRADARRRGVAEGRSEAAVVAQTAVEPLMDGRPLSQPLTPAELSPLRRLAGTVAAITWS